jgi:hypothetical protein
VKEVSDVLCLVPNRLIPQHHFATLQYQSVNVLLTGIHTMEASIDCRKLDDTCKFLEALFLFWCFGLDQIFNGSNQSCDSTRFVVLDSGVQVLVPWTGAAALFLELAQEWDQGSSLFTRYGTENDTTVEYMFRLFRWASQFFFEKVGK